MPNPPTHHPTAFFSLDIGFDWLEPDQLGCSVTRRSRGFFRPATWDPVAEQLGKPGELTKLMLGGSKDDCYLRVAVWGRHVDPATDQVLLQLMFSKAADGKSQATSSPFDPPPPGESPSPTTQKLAQGIRLRQDDVFYFDGTTALWIVNPITQGLDSAGYRQARESVLWFNYFPELTHGHYDFHARLQVHRSPAEKTFGLDPEMEVGEDDQPTGPDIDDER